ncbi:hypothetical protein [Planomonospora venezuelensis]|uniref:hypothetical protein n=1 Tax=Planomonospora venezuelensis TaxID=1999 RepID=UPI001AC27B11|nr:hypothetical protein Pve01_43970 [Planomonospora venezuelensis]
MPTVNATRNEFTESGPINVPESGSVTAEEGLRALLIIDACPRVRDGVPHPPVLRAEEHGGHGAGSAGDQEQALLADVPAFVLHVADGS